MRALITLFIAAFLAGFAATPSLAQGTCVPRADLARVLSQQHSEAPVALGLASNGNLVEVFASKDALKGMPSVAINISSNGSFVLPPETTWTGTKVGGLSDDCGSDRCDNWTCGSPPCGINGGDTALSGDVDAVNDQWTTSTCQFCDVESHLICLEQ